MGPLNYNKNKRAELNCISFLIKILQIREKFGEQTAVIQLLFTNI